MLNSHVYVISFLFLLEFQLLQCLFKLFANVVLSPSPPQTLLLTKGDTYGRVCMVLVRRSNHFGEPLLYGIMTLLDV